MRRLMLCTQFTKFIPACEPSEQISGLQGYFLVVRFEIGRYFANARQIMARQCGRSIGKKEGGHGHNPFWEFGNEKLMRETIKILDLAGEPVSIVNIDRVIKSLPSRLGEHEAPAWQKKSYCAQLIDKVRARQDTLTTDQWSDLEVAMRFAFQQWPSFDERPRSSLEMTWGGDWPTVISSRPTAPSSAAVNAPLSRR
jgi:hypothetical protein